jgi:hypothetical protein
MTDEWSDIHEPPTLPTATAASIALGPVIPPQQLVLLYSPSEWEDLIHEWLYYCRREQYFAIRRFTGSGDRGIDIAGFEDEKLLQGKWDNYQCKHYGQPLRPSDIWVEIGKIIWHSYKKHYAAPRNYYFVSPRGPSTSLTSLLADSANLCSSLIANWDKSVRTKITSTTDIPLDADLLKYIRDFDFSVFDAIEVLQIVQEHQKTPIHSARFGGGLKPRPPASHPPSSITASESLYVAQLLVAYSEHTGTTIADVKSLSAHRKLQSHFHRQREAFYHAESLRLYARDSVPPGSYEALQDDIFDGVIDTHDQMHPDGYAKVCKVTEAARLLQITENPLITCTRPKDRDGICQQLANEDRLQWKTS